MYHMYSMHISNEYWAVSMIHSITYGTMLMYIKGGYINDYESFWRLCLLRVKKVKVTRFTISLRFPVASMTRHTTVRLSERLLWCYKSSPAESIKFFTIILNALWPIRMFNYLAFSLIFWVKLTKNPQVVCW